MRGLSFLGLDFSPRRIIMEAKGGSHMPFQRRDWEELTNPLTGERRRAMAFLWDHLPVSDLDCYPARLFLRFADHAVSLRETAPWCGALDWEIFAHYVLFPRVNDEDLSFHRELFHAGLWPRIKDLPGMEERVLEINRWCCEHASYQAQDERTASPLTVYRCGSGRCGEESAFLVSALRSVGIPARQVYAPRWSHCDDNHAWVEALCGGRWRFLGACEPEPALDRGWFNTAASRAVLVHSRVFGEGSSPLHGEPLGRTGEVTWFNQTARYADTADYTFRAMAGERPAAGARFQLQILNEASFHTIAVLTADERGEAHAALGRGSLHVLAALGGLTAEGDCGRSGITLTLAPPQTEDISCHTEDVPWADFDFHAPADNHPVPAVLDRAQKAARAEALRRTRLAGFSEPGQPVREDLRSSARGNWGEVRAFLDGVDGERRERLVRTLSDKDLRDVTRDILEAHFAHLPPRRSEVPEDIYWQYAACPRIALEPLTSWRGPLGRWLEGWTGEPAALWQKVQADAPMCAPAYNNLYWTPAEVLSNRRCDEKSRRLLFVAALRTLGVPARLRPLDGAAEYWAGDRFRPVEPSETGTLRLTAPEALRYGQDWSLSQWTEAGWRLLHPENGWDDGGQALALPAGRYRVITTVRLPAGDQLASACEIELAAGMERTVPLGLRPWSAGDLLSRQPLPALAAEALDGRQIPDLFRMGDGPVLALWLEEGGEPAEHVLGELMDRKPEVAALPVRLLFLVRGRDSLTQPTLAKTLGRLGRIEILLDDWAYDLETAARCLGRDPEHPPLSVLCDGMGTALYSASGYRAGGVELLLRAARAAFPPK